MAIVYRARERALDREVAIKILPLARTFDAELVARFQLAATSNEATTSWSRTSRDLGRRSPDGK